MTEYNHFLLSELIESGSDNFLKEMRDGFTERQSFDSLCDEDKEIIGIINDYFDLKKKLDSLIPEKTTGNPGIESIEFNHGIFAIQVTVLISNEWSPATQYAPETNDYNYDIQSLIITLC